MALDRQFKLNPKGVAGMLIYKLFFGQRLFASMLKSVLDTPSLRERPDEGAAG